MHATPLRTPPPALLDSLQALAERQLAAQEQAHGLACFRARHTHGVQRVDVAGPALAVLLRGRKCVRAEGQDHRLRPGELLLMRRPCRIDAVNAPDARGGPYLSLSIALCEEVVSAARLLWAQPIPTGGPAVVRCALAPCEEALGNWSAAMLAGDDARARLALAALLLQLCHAGHAGVLAPPPPSVAAQLRALVAQQPERDWQSRHFEDALGLSGATLRRRLQAEHTNVRELVAETRLARALELLYATSWPVKTVAARVGYRSVASFTRRFSARYGLEPTRIGNTP